MRSEARRRATPKPRRRKPERGSEAGTGRVRRIDAERHSLALLLDLARSGRASTRLDLEKQSGLGRAVVADRLATLARLGLVEEGERGAATGGRAPRLVRFRAGGGLILVAALDQTTLGVGVADLAGRLLLEHHEAADIAAGPGAMLERVGTLFDWILEQHRADRDVWGVGLSLPGPVELAAERTGGRPRLHFAPTWADHPIVEQLIVRYRAPVHIRSTVQMMALGEMRTRDPGVETLLFVKLGNAITAGLIAAGGLHVGAQGAAGLIGHIPVGEASTAACRCGNVGCLEAVAGGEAIAREAMKAAAEGRSRQLAEARDANSALTASDVVLAAQLGDAFSAELLSRCGRLVGTVLAGLANALNPSLIVLGGSIAQAGDILLAAIREAVYRHSHPLVTRDLRIVLSQMGNSAGLVGSALAVVDELFARDSVEHWIGFGSPLRHPDMSELVSRAGRAISEEKRGPTPPGDNRVRSGSAS
jgi:predicted NBD/HSP70 family sugar kinase